MGVKTRFGGDGTYARKVPRSLVRYVGRDFLEGIDARAEDLVRGTQALESKMAVLQKMLQV